MSQANENSSNDSRDDRWASTVGVYDNQAARITEVFGADLLALLSNDVLAAKTILDIGCGTGALAKAYLLMFPKGVSGQTFILSDSSPGMLAKAQDTVRPPQDCQTTFVFQEEDGTHLTGIDDDSIDIVFSLFGIFLIPDQVAAMQAVHRVLKKPNGVFGNASWVFGISDQLAALGYGVSCQDAFRVPMETIDPSRRVNAGCTGAPDDTPLLWSDAEKIEVMLTTATETPRFQSALVYRSIHTTAWTFGILWHMMVVNPMSHIQGASDEDVAKARLALKAFLARSTTGKTLVEVGDDTLFLLSSASNLAIARGVLLD